MGISDRRRTLGERCRLGHAGRGHAIACGAGADEVSRAMPYDVGKADPHRNRAAAVTAALLAWSAMAAPLAIVRADELAPAARHDDRNGWMITQLPRYSAGGTHQCGSNVSCVVSGQFMNCSDARTTLQTRDCCPTTKKGGTSTGFALTYCIPELSRP